MNRHERRRAAATSNASAERQRTIAMAADVLTRAAAADCTVSGATLITPDGEVIYLPAPAPSQVTQ